MRNEKQIRAYLTEVSEYLQQLGVIRPFHIVVSGGAFMIINKQRAFTEDIDFASIQVPSHIPQGKFLATIIHDEITRTHSGIPFAHEFRQAIFAVAQNHALAEDWLNDQAAEYLYDDAPHPEVELWHLFGNLLHVYLPTAEYILATKLAAGRPKDTNDIEKLIKTLKIKRREQIQLVVDKFLLPDAQEFWQVDEKIDDLFD